MNDEIYEGTPAKEDVLIGTDSGYNRYRRPDGSTYVHYPYSLMTTVTAYSAKDGKGLPIRTANGKLITGRTQAEADRNRFRYDMNHWVEANRRKTAHLPQDWRSKYTLSEGKDILTMTPIAGDVLDLGNVYSDFNRGNYGMAAAGLGLFFLPNIVEKPLKWAGKPIIRRINNYRAAKAFSEVVDESVIPEHKFNPYSDRPANYVLSVPLTEDVGRTSLKLLERPSKLTEAELAGIPKGERNLVRKPNSDSDDFLYIGAAKDNRRLFTPEEISEADPFIALNMKSTNETALKRSRKSYMAFERNFPNKSSEIEDFNIILLEYTKTLPEADKMFLRDDGLRSRYIEDFRNYLNTVGYDAEDVSDELLARLITQQYRDLTSTMSGKAKGMVMWHSSPKSFDVFDFNRVGENTGNMGAGGPGNYFSGSRAEYGKTHNNDDILNTLPYLINNITSTPKMSHMVSKGLLPSFIHPKYILDKDAYKKMIKDLLEKTPKNDNKLYIDNVTITYPGTLQRMGPNGDSNFEYLIRRNTGIKSLFPHPSLFKRNADGTISLIRNWDDPRVNYKTGGKLIKKQ